MEPPALAMGLVPSMDSYQACLAIYNRIKSVQYGDEIEPLVLSLTREHQRFSTLVPQLMILQQPVLLQLVEGSLKEFKVTLQEFHDVALRSSRADAKSVHLSSKSKHDAKSLEGSSIRDSKRLAVLVSHLRDLNDQLSYLMPEIQLAGSTSKLMANPAADVYTGRNRDVKKTIGSHTSEVKAPQPGKSATDQGVDLTRLPIRSQIL